MDKPSDETPALTPPEDSPPVRTAEDLLLRWRQLMGPWGFGRRSLWVLWFDAEGFQAPVVMPIDDIPTFPDERMVSNLMYVVDRAGTLDGEAEGAVTVAMALSRPGTPRVTDGDRAWARALRRHADAAGVALWPVHLATAGEVRPLTLDDVGSGGRTA